jgi:pimeloyl-ACP methyl ester carboxylesterase
MSVTYRGQRPAAGAGPVPRPGEVRDAYARVLAGAPARSRHVEVAGGWVHLLEAGAGSPMVMLPGTGSIAGLFRPLLDHLDGVRAIAADRPGQGLSDPLGPTRDPYRETAVTWLDHLLDALDLDTTTLLGHSGGAVWALWYALARPDRIRRLVLIGPPAVPGTRCPLPLRLNATPGLGALLKRLVPPSPAALLRFAAFMGEGETLPDHPDLLHLWAATSRDPIADAAARAEFTVLIPPFALLSRSGFRRRAGVRADELRRLAVPTLLVWGERDPLGGLPVAGALTKLIPRARLETTPTGHAPWLGHPASVAAAICEFLR